MSELSEFAQRVLSELEEVVEDNVFTIVNTVGDRTGEQIELSSFMRALAELVAADLALMGIEGFVPRDPEYLDKEGSVLAIENLKAWFDFDPSKRFWVLQKGDIRTERIPFVVLTQVGRAEANRIIDRKGYKWWNVEDID